ncbi:MAG TPA: hypothetical protein VKQ11_03355 [Candidatus Sulfotelmatobacter sp.]|nr:hypothetical protein [Candidatus Sulfotelmatobacter sp.]
MKSRVAGLWFGLAGLLASAALVPVSLSASTRVVSGGDSAPATVSVTLSPKSAAVAAVSQTQQFTATVSGTTNTSVTWSVAGVIGGNLTVGTISTGGLYTPPAKGGVYSVTATSVADPTVSASATVAVTALPGVLTYHNDLARDGANKQEYALKPATVKTASFGKLFSCSVDGAVYTQPLWMPNVSIAGGAHNVIFVATQHDSAYAFDADASPCVTYWKVNLLDTLHGGTSGEASVTWNDVGNCFGDIYPEVGVTGTPVIDHATNTIYMVSASEKGASNSGSCSGTVGTFYHRLHALDIATGSEKFNAPVTIAASVPGTGDGSVGGIVSFNSQLSHQRSGLALTGGNVVVAFSAHEDATPYHGWVISYQASNVQQQTAVFNTTPNGLNGADGGIWAAGGAPAVDSGGDIYVTTGNGDFDEINPNPDNDYGDSILRLHPFSGNTLNGVNLSIAGWFTPYDEGTLQLYDTDLGSGAVVLLPNQNSGAGPVHLLVQTGKEGVVYLIDRDNMGQFNSSNNDQIRQSFRGPSSGLWGTPGLWQNNVYIGGAGDSVKEFSFSPTTELFNTSVISQSAHVFQFPGAALSISSQAAMHGIVWAIDATLYGYASPSGGTNCYMVPVPPSCTGPAILHAYSAGNLATEYWNSTMAANHRDQAGNAVKFVPPTVANGKVYVSTRTEVDVYGILPK